MNNKKNSEKQFRQILYYGLQKGHETTDVSIDEFIKDISKKLVTMVNGNGGKTIK